MEKKNVDEGNGRAFLHQPMTYRIRDEFESSMAHMFIAERISPAEAKAPQLTFMRVLPYLKSDHGRWRKVKEEHLNFRKQACSKQLNQMFHQIRKDERLWDELVATHINDFSPDPSAASVSEAPIKDPPKKQKKPRKAKAPHCLLYTSPSPRDRQKSRMPSSA